MEDTAQMDYGADMGTNGGSADHTARLLRAALPYLNSGLKGPLDLLLKGIEFFEAAREFRVRDTLTAFQYTQPANLIADPDGLIHSVRQVANPSELKLLDLFAGLNNARKFYEMYQSLAPFMSEFNPAGYPSGQPEDESDPLRQGAPASSGPDLDSFMKMAEIMRTLSDTGEKPHDGEPDTGRAESAPQNSMFRNSSSQDSVTDFLSLLVPKEQQDTLQALKLLLTPSDNSPAPEPGNSSKSGNSSSDTETSAGVPYAHYTPGTLPYTIPPDADVCSCTYYDGFDQPDSYPVRQKASEQTNGMKEPRAGNPKAPAGASPTEVSKKG